MRTTMISKEEFAKTLTDGYEKRHFIVSHLKDFAFHLNEAEAFAFARLLPKELVKKLLSDRQMGVFMDKIQDHHSKISVGGPVAELEATKVAEEAFLAGKGAELLTQLSPAKISFTS